MKRVNGSPELRELQPDKPATSEIIADMRLGHVAPAASPKKQSVFGTQIGEMPLVAREDAIVRPLFERGSHCKNELSIPPRRSRVRCCSRVVGRCYGDHVNFTNSDPLKTSRECTCSTAKSNSSYTTLHSLSHGPQCFDMQPQGDGWKLPFECANRPH